jgi:hypothetical protein
LVLSAFIVSANTIVFCAPDKSRSEFTAPEMAAAENSKAKDTARMLVVTICIKDFPCGVEALPGLKQSYIFRFPDPHLKQIRDGAASK